MSLSSGPPKNRRPFPKRAEMILLKNGTTAGPGSFTPWPVNANAQL
jgi:hypothetical protein